MHMLLHILHDFATNAGTSACVSNTKCGAVFATDFDAAIVFVNRVYERLPKNLEFPSLPDRHSRLRRTATPHLSSRLITITLQHCRLLNALPPATNTRHHRARNLLLAKDVVIDYASSSSSHRLIPFYVADIC